MYQQLRDLRLEELEVDSVSSQVDMLMQLTRKNGEDKYCSRRDKFMEVGLFIRGGLKFKQWNGCAGYHWEDFLKQHCTAKS